MRNTRRFTIGEIQALKKLLFHNNNKPVFSSLTSTKAGIPFKHCSFQQSHLYVPTMAWLQLQCASSPSLRKYHSCSAQHKNKFSFLLQISTCGVLTPSIISSVSFLNFSFFSIDSWRWVYLTHFISMRSLDFFQFENLDKIDTINWKLKTRTFEQVPARTLQTG